MYVFFLGETPIYFKIFTYSPKTRELSEENINKICIIEKIQNINSYKTVGKFSIKPLKNW